MLYSTNTRECPILFLNSSKIRDTWPVNLQRLRTIQYISGRKHRAELTRSRKTLSSEKQLKCNNLARCSFLHEARRSKI